MNGKTQKIKCKIKMFHDFTEPYMYDEDLDNIVVHKSYDEYVVHSKDMLVKVLDEFLDAPKKKLTSKDIHKDFDSVVSHLSDARVEAIKNYYNGRLKLSNKMHMALNKIDFDKIDPMFPVTMKFNIPFELNFFSTEDNDPYSSHVKMNDAFIEVEIEKDKS